MNRVRKAADINARTIEQFIKDVACKEVNDNLLVLDIGAGSCPYEKLFKRQRYISTDFSLHQTNLDFISDAHRIPIKDNSVDVVVSTQMLEHVTDPEDVLEECYRVLNPGGRLFLTVPQLWQLHQEPHHYFSFTKYGLELLFKRAGFEIKDIKARGGYFCFMSDKIRFSSQIFKQYLRGRRRVLLYPFFCLHYVVFSLILPILLSELDWLDKEKKLTLGYQCICVKGES